MQDVDLGNSRWFSPTLLGPADSGSILSLSFADPSLTSSGGADLTNVRSINLRLSLSGAGSISVDSVRAVPEPGAALLLLAGLVVLARPPRW